MEGLEIWLPIDNYVGLYEISNFGRVKSLPRKMNNKVVKEKILNESFGANGYQKVSLANYGKMKTFLVHRLVALAFLGNKGHLQVNHKDLNPKNNHVSNLEWVTQSENNQHKWDNCKTKSSRHKGVSFKKKLNKWQAYIYDGNKQRYLGVFDKESDAVKIICDTHKALQFVR
jgi:hypothetical protein